SVHSAIHTLSLHDALPISGAHARVYVKCGSVAHDFIVNDGAGTDQTHLSPEHIPELRQFIKARSTQKAPHTCDARVIAQLLISRSEEHTSELQSRFDVVCR